MPPAKIAIAAAALALIGLAAPASAQRTLGFAGGSFGSSQDPAAAQAGTYKLDPTHASVVARLSHQGISITTLRFSDVAGELTWDPAKIEASKVRAVIKTGSMFTPIRYNVSPMSEGFLNVAGFPEATFVSTSVRRIDATHGQISGDLTLRGVTKPVVIDAELVGIKPMNGAMTIGFSGIMKIKRSDFGSTLLDKGVGNDIELMLDVEFLKS